MDLASALSLHQNGQLAEAAAFYRVLLAQDANDCNANRLLGLALKELGDHHGALYHLQVATRLMPGWSSPWIDLADLPPQLLTETPQTLLRRAATLETDANILAAIAYKLYAMYAYDDVVAIADHLLSKNDALPTAETLRSMRMISHVMMYNFAAAAIDLEHFLPNLAENQAIILGGLNAYYQLGRLDEAIVVLRNLAELSPESEEIRKQLARAMAAKGQDREALEYHAGMSFDAALDVVDRAIGDSCPTEGSLVLNLQSLRHLGHICYEPQAVRSIYRDRKLIILTKPRTGGGNVQKSAANSVPDTDLCNSEIWRMVQDRAQIVEIDEAWLRGLRDVGLGIFERNGRVYVFEDHQILLQHTMAAIARQGHAEPMRLVDEQRERGRALQLQMGIPDDARIVVLHVRELGYHPYYQTRCADPRTYLPLIRYLQAQGYHVVRIGDPTMTRLEGLGPGFHDMPFHPLYEPLAEPYFVEKCDFFIGMNSGPSELGRAMRRPMMIANASLLSGANPFAFELLGYKKVQHIDSGRYLSLREIVELNLTEVNAIEHSPFRGYRFEPLSSVELLCMGREMVGLSRRYGDKLASVGIGSGFEPTASQLQFHRVSQELDAMRRGDPTRYAFMQNDWLGTRWPQQILSDEYAFLNPHYLGGETISG